MRKGDTQTYFHLKGGPWWLHFWRRIIGVIVGLFVRCFTVLASRGYVRVYMWIQNESVSAYTVRVSAAQEVSAQLKIVKVYLSSFAISVWLWSCKTHQSTDVKASKRFLEDFWNEYDKWFSLFVDNEIMLWRYNNKLSSVILSWRWRHHWSHADTVACKCIFVWQDVLSIHAPYCVPEKCRYRPCAYT